MIVVVAVAVAPFNEGPSAVALALIAEAFKTQRGRESGHKTDNKLCRSPHNIQRKKKARLSPAGWLALFGLRRAFPWTRFVLVEALNWVKKSALRETIGLYSRAWSEWKQICKSLLRL